MRKTIFVILAAALVLFSFAACGEEGKTASTAATTTGNTVTVNPAENTAPTQADMEPTEPATEPTEPATKGDGAIDLPDIPW